MGSTTRHWEHETCGACKKPISEQSKYSCTEEGCIDVDICDSCYNTESADGWKIKGKHNHKYDHGMMRITMTDNGLPYILRSSEHEHLLYAYYEPDGSYCQLCEEYLGEWGDVYACGECDDWYICFSCLQKTSIADTLQAKSILDGLDSTNSSKGDAKTAQDEKVEEARERLHVHQHDLERYPKSPYGDGYGCDVCQGEFTGVVYHCVDCGEYDLCPSCYTDDVHAQQAKQKLQFKHDIVLYINSAVKSVGEFETKKPTENDEIHYAWYCHECKINNRVDARYDCLVCNAELCGTCMNKNSSPFIDNIKHQPGHPMERKRAANVMSNPATLVDAAMCDGCDAPNIEGNRYRCTQCPNYNWCESCYKKKVITKDHDAFHVMQTILGPGNARGLINKTCKVCEADVNYGAMLKCNVCVNFYICKFCFVKGSCAGNHKAVHSLSYFVAGQDRPTKKKFTAKPTPPPILIGDDTLDDMLKVCETEVKDIIAQHKVNGKVTKFTDADFPTDDRCLFQDPNDPPADWIKPTQYLRITDICSEPVLFSSGITPDDVDQGAIGTCYLLGDLSGIARFPHLIKEIFVAYDIEVGIYALRFFINNKWIYVVIDDYIACNANRRPLYGCCTDRNEIWVMLIEKAYAKIHQCYENINGGLERLAFSDLTGGVAARVKIPKGFHVNADGTTHAAPKLNRPIALHDDSLEEVERPAFTSGTFGNWSGNIFYDYEEDPPEIERVEFVLAFANGRIEGGGKNLDNGKQYTIEGSSDAVSQTVWFVLKEVLYLKNKKRPRPMFFAGEYNGDNLSIQGHFQDLEDSWEGRFMLSEDVPTESNVLSRIGPFSSIWDVLTIKHSEHVLMSCSIDDLSAAIEEKTPSGLLKNHAYSLMNFYKLEKNVLLVKLRNPHGRAGWQGAWKKGGSEWTKERITQVGDYVAEENGEFYMDFQTFLSLFNSIDMCRLFTDQWTLQVRDCEFTPTMCGGDSFWLENPQLRITPTERGKFVINLSQPDIKIYSGDDMYNIPIGFRIVYFPYPTDRVRESTGALVVCHVPPEPQKSVSIEIELDALDQPYFIIPYTSVPGKQLPFQVAVYSTAEFELLDVTYMDDPSCHPIPSGTWEGTLVPMGGDGANNETLTLKTDLYFDPAGSIIYGVGTDETGKYFTYGRYKWGEHGEWPSVELQMTYLSLYTGEDPPLPYYLTGTYHRDLNQIKGLMVMETEKEGTSTTYELTISPIPIIQPLDGQYSGHVLFNEEEIPFNFNQLIFKNNKIYGRDWDLGKDNHKMFSCYGNIIEQKNEETGKLEREVTMCMMQHGGREIMFFATLSDDLKTISGKTRGVFGEAGFIEADFEWSYNPEQTKALAPPIPEKEEEYSDPITEWYFTHRDFEIFEFLDKSAFTEEETLQFYSDIAEFFQQRKHYVDRVEMHKLEKPKPPQPQKPKPKPQQAAPKKPAANGKKKPAATGKAPAASTAQPAKLSKEDREAWNNSLLYSRTEMAKLGRNDMSRFGRAEMARLGRNEMRRFGRNEMKRYGRSEMRRFGRSEMRRFGRSEMRRFGRKEMRRFGRKERDDEEYDRRAAELKKQSVTVLKEEIGNAENSQKLAELENSLKAEKYKSDQLEQKLKNIEVQNIQATVDKNDATILELEQKLAQHTANSHYLEQALTSLQHSEAQTQELKVVLSQERKRSAQLEHELAELKQLLHDEKQASVVNIQTIASLQNLEAKLNAEIARSKHLENEIAATVAENSEIKSITESKLFGLQAQLKAEEEKSRVLEAKIQEKEKSQNDAPIEMTDVEDNITEKLQELESKLAQEKERSKSLEDKIAVVTEQQNAQESSKVKELTSKLVAEEEKAKSLEEKVSAAQKSEAKLKKLEAKLAEETEKAQKLELQIQQAGNSEQKSSPDLAIAEAKLKEIEAQLAEERENSLKLQKNYEIAQQSVVAKTVDDETIRNLELLLQEEKQKVKVLESKASQVSQLPRVNSYNDPVKKLEEQLEREIAKSKELEDKLESLTSSGEFADSENQLTPVEYDRKIKELENLLKREKAKKQIPKNTSDVIKNYEAKLLKERENVKILEEKLYLVQQGASIGPVRSAPTRRPQLERRQQSPPKRQPGTWSTIPRFPSPTKSPQGKVVLPKIGSKDEMRPPNN